MFLAVASAERRRNGAVIVEANSKYSDFKLTSAESAKRRKRQQNDAKFLPKFIRTSAK